jgi:iron(III) transport system permease protein
MSGGGVHAGPLLSRWLRNTGVQIAVTLVLAVLVLAPLLPMLVQAFASAPLFDARWTWTLDNIRDFVGSAEIWAVTVNTLIFAVAATAISQMVGAAAAILIGRTDLPLRGPLGDIFMLPLYLSHVVLAVGWLTMYAPGAYIETLWTGLGLPSWNLYSLAGMAVVAGIAEAPVAFIYCLYGASAGSGSALEDAARVSGAGRLRVLFRITLPMMIPALVYSGVLNFVGGLEMLAIPQLFGKSVNVLTLSTYLYDKAIGAPQPNHGLVACAAFLLIVLVGLSLWLQWHLLRTAFRYTTIQGKAGQIKRVSLGQWRWPAALLIGLYLVVTTLVPLIGLTLRALTFILTPLVPFWDVLTLDAWQRVFNEPRFLLAITNTIETGLATALLGTALCVALVLVAQRSSFRFRWLTDTLALLPRAFPGLIVGLGVFYAAVLVAPIGYFRGTIWILVFAYLMIMIPAGVGVIAPAALQISRELDRAARVSGADWLRTSISIILPLLKPAMAGSFMLLFIASLKAYTAAMFLFSPKTEVIGASMLLLMEDGDTGIACALAVIQILFTLAIVLVARRLFGVRIYG